MLGARLADGDGRRRLGQPVRSASRVQPSSSSSRSMVAAAGGAPAVRTRTPRGAPARTSAGAFAMPMSTVGAAHSTVIRSDADQLEHARGIDLAQAHVRRADGRDDPGERPAIRVEHRQRPQVAIGHAHRQMHQHADAVHVGVAVRDHHALRPRRGPARVVDRQQIGFVDRRRARTPAGWTRRASRSPASPSRAPSSATKCVTPGQGRPDPIDRVEVVGVRRRRTVAPQWLMMYCEVVRRQPVVDRHEHRADLRNGVERLELRVRVRRDVRDAIARARRRAPAGPPTSGRSDRRTPRRSSAATPSTTASWSA